MGWTTTTRSAELLHLTVVDPLTPTRSQPVSLRVDEEAPGAVGALVGRDDRAARAPALEGGWIGLWRRTCDVRVAGGGLAGGCGDAGVGRRYAAAGEAAGSVDPNSERPAGEHRGTRRPCRARGAACLVVGVAGTRGRRGRADDCARRRGHRGRSPGRVWWNSRVALPRNAR